MVQISIRIRAWYRSVLMSNQRLDTANHPHFLANSPFAYLHAGDHIVTRIAVATMGFPLFQGHAP